MFIAIKSTRRWLKMANSVEIHSIAGPSARKAILAPMVIPNSFQDSHELLLQEPLKKRLLDAVFTASLDANFPTKTLRKTKKKMYTS